MSTPRCAYPTRRNIAVLKSASSRTFLRLGRALQTRLEAVGMTAKDRRTIGLLTIPQAIGSMPDRLWRSAPGTQLAHARTRKT